MHENLPSVIEPTTELRPQKRSLTVPLYFLGGAAFIGVSMLSSGTDVQRNRYDTLEDCVHDYSTGQCQQEATHGPSGSGYYGGSRYYGPWYREGTRDASDPGPGRTLGGQRSFAAGEHYGGPRGTELGTRGGFGSSGRVSARGS